MVSLIHLKLRSWATLVGSWGALIFDLNQEKMKLPKETKRYCPYCKKHTLQSILTAKQKSRSATHPLSRGSSTREKLRGLRGGYGNIGRRSRKGPKDWKRKTKTTKRIPLVFKCGECGKMKGARYARRVSRIVIGDKVAK